MWIIHAERDLLLPLSEGQALFEACPAKNKRMLTIAGADHNALFFEAWKNT